MGTCQRSSHVWIKDAATGVMRIQTDGHASLQTSPPPVRRCRVGPLEEAPSWQATPRPDIEEARAAQT